MSRPVDGPRGLGTEWADGGEELPGTLVEALRRTAATYPDDVAVEGADGTLLTWGEMMSRVDVVAAGLAALGVERGDAVALMLDNRPEFHIVDLAAVRLGATPFSIYTTYPVEQIVHMLKDAEARVAITEQAFVDNMLEASRAVDLLGHVVVIDGEPPVGTVSLSEVEASRSGTDLDAFPDPDPDDLLTLIYTSGTTGPPKGVQLSHRVVIAAARAMGEAIPFERRTRVISWLPAAHIAERIAHHYLPVIYAGRVTCCPDPREILSYLPKVRPTWFFAVPRIWEKLKARLEATLVEQPAEQRRCVEIAMAASLDRVRLRQAGQPIPAQLEAMVAEADRAIFADIRVSIGLDRARSVNVGAAPTPVEVVEFFHAIGVELAEMWGQSETCGAGTCNPSGAVRIGTVGTPAKGCEIRIAEDGEVLLRADFVMLGYRNLPDDTAKAIDSDGWLHTGDIGASDADGYVRLVDRKKEIIINTGGKTMSPANIEALVKTSSPLIGQVCCIGDRRRYNSALVVLDAELAPHWARTRGIAAASLEVLARERLVVEAVQQGVDKANLRLSRVEQIKKFTILEGDWTPGGDELTPTMKLKRKPIAAKYKLAIEAMYSERTSDRKPTTSAAPRLEESK